MANEPSGAENAAASQLLGNAQRARAAGSWNQAIPLFLQFLHSEPNHPEAVLGLAECFSSIGATVPAGETAARAIELNPDSCLAWELFAKAHESVFLFRAAAEAYEKALDLCPGRISSLIRLGECFRRQALLKEAKAVFEQAVGHEGSLPAVYGLGDIARQERDIHKSDELFQQALDGAKELGLGELLAVATVFHRDSHLDWAEKTVNIILADDPNNEYGLLHLARIRQEQGDFPAAEALLRRILDQKPMHARALYDIVYGRRMTTEDEEILKQLRNALMRPRLDLESRRLISYALGKANDDLKRYEEAMGWYDEANATATMQLGKLVEDGTHIKEFVDSSIKTFTKEHIEEFAQADMNSDLPILIVGMIRSGTTLVEQMLSSHPDIGAAGEVHFLRMRSAPVKPDDPNFDPVQALREYGDDYVACLRGMAPGKLHVTDKMPLNYSVLGQLHMALPKVKIIHVRRHPVDTCVSMYVTPFQPNLNYGHSRARIAAFYRQYLRQMNHWRRVLPKGTMIEVDYESIIENREPVLRRMIEFLGLEWSDQLLHHDRNERIIQTPSQWQARQPIYKSSMQRWLNYKGMLGEFEEFLSPAERDLMR